MPWQLLVSLVEMIITESQWSNTEITCGRSTYYCLSIPFKSIVLANAYPWTSLRFHVHPSKSKDGILQCISFDLWCKNRISFDQSCKECISCERDAQHLDGRAGRKARGKCRVHPRSSSIEIQLSGCGEVQVQVQIQALVLLQVRTDTSTSTWCKYIPEADQSKHNLMVKQCCNVVEWLLVR